MTAPWIARQSWLDLLFAHWPARPEVRPLLPRSVAVDLYHGEAWVRVVPFRLRDMGPRGLSTVRPGRPPLPRRALWEAFLVERYRLFTTRAGVPFRVDVEHEPWPLRPAEADVTTETMAAAAGVALPERSPLLHFVDRLDVRTGPPLPVVWI